MTKKRLNFTFRVIKDGETIQRCQTHSRRRFQNRIGTINWRNRPFKVYLRVSYGKVLTNFKKMENFYNDGEYATKYDLLDAFKAFTEPELLEEFKE